MKEEPQPDLRSTILDALEVCRPYSDDLADAAMAAAADQLRGSAELAARFRHQERLDARIAAAFVDVPVPDGLAERILQGLAEAPAPQAEETFAAVEEPGPAEPLAVVAGAGPRVSRRWLVLGTAGIVAATVMITAAVLHVRLPQVDRPNMLDAAIQFFDGDWEELAGGRPIAGAAPGGGFPLSPHVLQGDWVRRRNVSEFLGRRGVAYDLTRPGGPRATLYVVKYPLVGLPSRPSREPTLTTHDRSTSAWQAGPTLFVLVVEGGPRTYRAYLNLPSGPVA